jgi:lipoprotein signal peptidase
VFKTILNCGYFFEPFLSSKIYSIVVFLLALGVVCLLYKYHKPAKLTSVFTLGILLFLAGAFLNSYERFVSGCVTDYFDFIGLFKFNANDLMVTLGAGIIVGKLYGK